MHTVPVAALRRFLLLCPVLLAACAAGPRPDAPRPLPELAPAAWQAPLPHGGQPAAIAQWWQGWGDATLAQLVQSAQSASTTLAQARTRIAEARQQRTSAAAALGPRLDATGSATRGVTNPLFPQPSTTIQAGLQASWEADLFGGLAAARDAAQERLQGAQAGWHEARVSVAAETAAAYFQLRSCALQEDVTRADSASRSETARLTRLAADAGFQAPANAALAEASAADGAMRLSQQQARCAIEVKALAALTGIEEPRLRQLLAQGIGALPAPPAIPALPAQLLAQRPDLYRAEREVVAAAAGVATADAQRLPRVTLAGSVAGGLFSFGGVDRDLRTWSLGPVSVTLPLVDGGVIAAGRESARARYDEAVAVYTARVRQAVREVEEALVQLDSTHRREADAQRAVQGFRVSLAAAEARWRAGLGSLIELEDQRRQALAAQSALVSLQLERANALVSLYRASGGGWSREQAAMAASPESR
jgi:NodT family efflux transporter outer membrane factor (OMF) lipoprotein